MTKDTLLCNPVAPCVRSPLRQHWNLLHDFLPDGAPKITKVPYKRLNSMVYGRYNYTSWGL